MTGSPADPGRAAHLGAAPGWDCAACSQPWPCAPAKEELLAEYHRFPSSLVVYMSSYLTEALDDLTTPDGLPLPDLWTRFLGWIQPGRTGLTPPRDEQR